jgi:hypothetical protein
MLEIGQVALPQSARGAKPGTEWPGDQHLPPPYRQHEAKGSSMRTRLTIMAGAGSLV